MSLETTNSEHITEIRNINVERLSRSIVRDDPDIRALAASMAVEGLRHPILLMPGGAELLKGGRRIAAALYLGWTTIPARAVQYIDDAVDAIVDVRDEFTHPRTWEQRVFLGLTMETLDHKPGADTDVLGTNGYPDYTGLIACALSTSGSGYKRARTVVTTAHSGTRPAHVVAVARHALTQLDAGLMTLTNAYNRVRLAEKGADESKKVDEVGGVSDDGLPRVAPPSPAARSPKARQLRIEWIRALAKRGATTNQIADRIGIGLAGVRKIVRDEAIEVPADHVLNRQQRKAADPNKVVQVAVEDLDALLFSLNKVDVTALDIDQAKDWGVRLTQHAKVLGRVARSIKGVTQ